ncbi:MAG: Mur ligase family protein [Bifidobacterium mongoliense]|jgi:UDP-N-acetylmuramoyl-L-alanyl-D-glutamate--2,6-diaminopimelate ligase|uniref:Mur ligase family protein n=1 Tax=Bifidobacterium mongoliense TaxID=518643 RepID=UPI002F3546EF
MALSLASAVQLLKRAGLLREVIAGNRWTLDPGSLTGADRPFVTITYDTRAVAPGSLLCCKGRFNPAYLDGIDQHGLAAYVAQTPYAERTQAPGIIVTDIRKAMSLLSAAFYGMPQRELTLVGITGTKGKTTTAYYLQAILNRLSGNACALFSSVDNCLDGTTYEESSLTTPESMDAFRMMREALDHGMRYLVMEVSSQAYKVDRVFGLTFDVGAFLNISPDHISPIEHPTFEDYLFCKRQIVRNSRHLVLNVDCDHADLIGQDATEAHVPVTTFALEAGEQAADWRPRADVTAIPADPDHERFSLVRTSDGTATATHTDSHTVGPFHLAMDGDFNYANAAAAYALAGLAIETHDEHETHETPTNDHPTADAAANGAANGAANANANAETATSAPIRVTAPNDSPTVDAIDAALLEDATRVRVSGRMERFEDPSGDIVAIVDYAHNYSSVGALIDFVEERYGSRHPRISLVTGSAGNKAIDRRKEIIQAAEHRIAKFFLTIEDTGDESVLAICQYMQRAISDPHVDSMIVDDRAEAIEQAVGEARSDGGFNVVLVIGKGDERWIKRAGKHLAYEGDDHVVRRLFGLL